MALWGCLLSLRQLRVLDLGYNQIGDDGLAGLPCEHQHLCLAISHLLPFLPVYIFSLLFPQHLATLRPIRAVAHLQWLPSLSTINLISNQLTQTSLHLIARLEQARTMSKAVTCIHVFRCSPGHICAG